MVEVTSEGNFKKTRNFLNKLKKGSIFSDLSRYGELGVRALSKATPVDTGLAQHSWDYRIIQHGGIHRIEWFNTDVVMGGTSIVILIQYGHGTGTGGYVQGRDFINPAMQPVFDQIANDLWKKVKSI